VCVLTAGAFGLSTTAAGATTAPGHATASVVPAKPAPRGPHGGGGGHWRGGGGHWRGGGYGYRGGGYYGGGGGDYYDGGCDPYYYGYYDTDNPTCD
jgi:hypothetical protein